MKGWNCPRVSENILLTAFVLEICNFYMLLMEMCKLQHDPHRAKPRNKIKEVNKIHKVYKFVSFLYQREGNLLKLSPLLDKVS